MSDIMQGTIYLAVGLGIAGLERGSKVAHLPLLLRVHLGDALLAVGAPPLDGAAPSLGQTAQLDLAEAGALAGLDDGGLRVEVFLAAPVDPGRMWIQGDPWASPRGPSGVRACNSGGGE
jgi:hypothetical protein